MAIPFRQAIAATENRRAESAARRMPIPLDPRKKPADVKVHVKSGAGVDITWADGHASHYDFAYLREECPCATCNDERGKKEAFAATASFYVQSQTSRARRQRSRQLRRLDQLHRRPLDRHLQLRPPPHDLPLPRLPQSLPLSCPRLNRFTHASSRASMQTKILRFARLRA